MPTPMVAEETVYADSAASVWVGLFALLCGIKSFTVAFSLRHLDKTASAAPIPMAVIEGRGS